MLYTAPKPALAQLARTRGCAPVRAQEHVDLLQRNANRTSERAESNFALSRTWWIALRGGLEPSPQPGATVRKRLRDFLQG
jgi:hypothetical protein